MKKNPKCWLFIYILLFYGCSSVGKLQNYDKCDEFYTLSFETVKVDCDYSTLIKDWETRGFVLEKKTLYKKNGRWSSPQIKILNYSNPKIDLKIDFLDMVVYGESKTHIQIYGICLKEKPEKEISKSQLKLIRGIIKADLLGKYKQ